MSLAALLPPAVRSLPEVYREHVCFDDDEHSVFVRSADFDWADVVRRLRAQGVGSVRLVVLLSGASGFSRDWLTSPELAFVHELSTVGVRWHDADFAALLLDAPTALLRRINLYSCELSDALWARLRGSARLPSLERLELSGTNLSAAAIETLVSPGSFPSLRAMKFDFDTSDGARRRSPDDVRACAAAFAAASPDCALRDLHLHCWPFDDDSFATLFGSALFGRLEKLWLGGVALSPAGASSLRDGLAPGAMRELSLGVDYPYPRAQRMHLLLESASLRGLRSLDLGSAAQYADELLPLALNPEVGSLRALHLRQPKVSARVWAALARSERLDLTTLDLSNCRLAEASTAKLLRAPLTRRIESLSLDYGRVSPATLAHSTQLRSLRHFNCFEGSLGDAHLDALARGAVQALETLYIACNLFTADGLGALVSSPVVASLRRLSINRVSIGDAGLVAIARSPHLGALRWLDVVGCGVTPQGLLRLADAVSLTPGLRVQVEYNAFDPSVYEALAARGIELIR